MYPKQEVVAMLLAGGQGSRLGVLTQKLAKPAVPFGGKYRIIDFPLSNCINSGIDAVGVLTQYQPLVLNEYIGNGQPWDLDSNSSGVSVLSPYQQVKGADWYSGTANAIYQNINYIDRYNPDYVVILSGDHIYKMDYNAMLKDHIRNGADATIAVRPVPWEEAPRFGIMNTDDENRIIEFEEKPKNPKSNKASMGVYIFTWEKLRQYLIDDEANKKSSNDFGKNIIPSMLNDQQRIFAYYFEGYWKDVGTIESLWEANMDLLMDPPPINLHDKSWRIYAKNPGFPPHYVAKGASVTDSLVTEGSEIYGNVNHSIIFAGVVIEEGANVRDSVIMPGSIVRRGAVVRRTIVSEHAVIGAGAIVGEETGNIAVIGHGVTLPAGVSVKAGVQVDQDTTF